MKKNARLLSIFNDFSFVNDRFTLENIFTVSVLNATERIPNKLKECQGLRGVISVFSKEWTKDAFYAFFICNF